VSKAHEFQTVGPLGVVSCKSLVWGQQQQFLAIQREAA